jgi:hypothetical protein
LARDRDSTSGDSRSVKPPNIVIDERTGMMRVAFAPGATIEDWKASRPTVVQLAQEKRIRRVLVDVRSQKSENGPVHEMFEFGATLPIDMAFAVLSDPRRSDHAFVETVAVNRGKRVKLFYGPEEEAIEWLTSLDS